MNDTVASLLREYHRRLTHYKQIPSGEREPLADAQVSGELIGLRGALGIALGGQVRGGEADRLAVQEYNRWAASGESEDAACTCVLCRSQVRQVIMCGNGEGEAYVPLGREIGRHLRRARRDGGAA